MDTTLKPHNTRSLLASSLVLLLLGLAYLILLGFIFGSGLNLENNRTVQLITHLVVLLSGFSFLIFADQVCSSVKEVSSARLALTFAALFTLLITLGRSLGIWYIMLPNPDAAYSLYNFYAAGDSLPRTIELISWTVFYPFSILFLGLFLRKSSHRFGRALFVLSILSAVCCFIAFMLLIKPDTIFFIIGATGWGLLFELIIAVYFIGLLPRRSKRP